MSNPTDKASVAARLRAEIPAFEKIAKNYERDGEPKHESQKWWRNMVMLLTEAVATLSPAQGDGMRDALVKIAALIEDNRETYPEDPPRIDGVATAGVETIADICKTALASHPDRQPDMTDELVGALKSLLPHMRWATDCDPAINEQMERDIEAANAAIKRVSQRQ